VIATTLLFPILFVQYIHYLVLYVIRKTRAYSLSQSTKCVLSAYALYLLFTFVALLVLQELILHNVIDRLMLSEEERLDAVWMPKIMSMYYLSTF